MLAHGQLALGSSEVSTWTNAVGNDRRVAMRGASAVSVMLELNGVDIKREVAKGVRGSGERGRKGVTKDRVVHDRIG